MSISFVSKSIQTANDDGNYEEKPIEGASTTTTTSHFQKPLHEQLRDNQEQAAAEAEERQRAIMRGTLALDEEDAAHLTVLEAQRRKQESERLKETQEQLAAFRAAQAERQQPQTRLGSFDVESEEEEGSTGADSNNNSTQLLQKSTVQTTRIIEVKKATPLIVPKFAAKKRSNTEHLNTIEKDQKRHKEDDKNHSNDAEEANGEATNLHNLLSGYGSASESD